MSTGVILSDDVDVLMLFFPLILMNQYRWLSSKSSAASNAKSTFEEKFLSQQSQNSGFFFPSIATSLNSMFVKNMKIKIFIVLCKFGGF